MKITPPSSRPIGAQAPGGRADTPAGAAPSAAAPGGGSAQVALSPASRQLLALQDGGSDINVERVAAIRAAIASGQLQIDAGRIADSLIASARDLLK
ncbi:flagellar biosynthesis anti-sigma factor FlgM [Bordetella petrii]|uniref:flagellar biosynthesis anti-sigma factor FlgM n=1 Tax=Bordetella petrii TaxID=94624 RepID=UPI001A9624A1|nr:flagellar biosynthesis anti-sigma factor FlgM [Bordetella petrii]MBO1111107.1 flagellar biosynthesis anti-sigma factor FlgM [Bordetella petrii]